MEKTQVHSIINLDGCGSMNSIRQAAVDSFNKTLAGIRKAQQKSADTQEHFISLVTFCSCEMKMGMSIHNTRNFAYNEESINACMRKDANSRMNFYFRLAQIMEKEHFCYYSPSTKARHSRYAKIADEALEKKESKEE